MSDAGLEALRADVCDSMRRANDAHSVFIESKTREIDALYRQMGASLAQQLWGMQHDMAVYGEATLAIPIRARGTLTATGVVALTTLCAMEWLRHRKVEVAAAEASGDYTSLLEEFGEWLRALFAMWRKALGITTEDERT